MAVTSSNKALSPGRWIQPGVLARLGNFELIARTVVDGLLTGLHRSPHFGFSQEFAEYRAYNEGDDLRYVDWNVFARTDKTYIKRFRGETNTSLTVLLDTSASMNFSEGSTQNTQDDKQTESITKFDYARYLAACLSQLAKRQHDAVGLMMFDHVVGEVVPPSSRPDTLPRIYAALDRQQASQGTDVDAALDSLNAVSGRRGLVAVISDFYTDPDELMDSLQPLVHRQQDIVLFHLLTSDELAPAYGDVVSLKDVETDRQIDVDAEWLNNTYRQRIQSHCDELEALALRQGADYCRIEINEPLDDALLRYLLFRQRKR